MDRLLLSALINRAEKFSIFRLKLFICIKGTNCLEMIKKSTRKLIKMFHKQFYLKMEFIWNLSQYKYFIIYFIFIYLSIKLSFFR